MTNYKISYVLTTYNKLPYLKEVLRRLVEARQPDEEVVVCDGGSKDGTVEYLEELYEAGLIQQFVSERDKGEAHGFNKGMLMARGEIIKLITDDDAFYYPAIRHVAKLMLADPAIDVVLGYSAGTQLEDLSYAYLLHGPRRQFERWQEDKTPFWMVGLTLTIRRKSLALTGLLFTGAVLTDAEFTMRVTSLKANIAWYTGVMSMHLSNSDGNMYRMNTKAVQEEGKRVANFYSPSAASRTITSKMRDAIEALKQPVRPLKRMVFSRLGIKQIVHREELPTGYAPLEGETNLAAAYRICDEFLAARNAEVDAELIYKTEKIGKVFHGDAIVKT